MAKITYLLGAGASYHACPILEKQAEMMIRVAENELIRLRLYINYDGNLRAPDFNDINDLEKRNENEYKILWYMGYFGNRANEYNTVDTYARKLFLNKEFKEYSLLKMCVSIFFDLWENFYYVKSEIKDFCFYNKIDNRYKALFSVLLDNENNKIKLNSNFKFITWNYDLQLEETFKLFLGKNFVKDFDFINSNYFGFKRDNKSLGNDVYHLNGHRGYFKDILGNNEKEIELNFSKKLNEYWNNLQNLCQATITSNANFDNYINYAWEHDLNDEFFQSIGKVLSETDVLVIIGYSFPAFNRKIDQFLLSKINTNKLKKIVYQDPNANEQMINNLFEKPFELKDKIEILNDEKSLKQFYLPNEYFISQQHEKKKQFKIYSTSPDTLKNINY